MDNYRKKWVKINSLIYSANSNNMKSVYFAAYTIWDNSYSLQGKKSNPNAVIKAVILSTRMYMYLFASELIPMYKTLCIIHL